ncbi:MAG: glycosyltransferase [Burkholderiales bacterium]
MQFSVVIPTYNRRHLLGAALDSVLGQGVSELEVIVVDDGSTDGTQAWLHEAYGGAPLRMLRNAGAKGPAGARNTGIRAARGQFIALLDSDDTFLPGHLAACADVFACEPSVDVVFGRARYERDGVAEDYMGPNFDRKLGLAPKSGEDAEVSVFGRGFFHHLLEYGCWFNLSTVALRREAALELMDERLRISEDYEFWVRLARRHTFACLHRPQIRYALHDSNISFDAKDTAADHAPRLVEALRIMRDYPGLDARARRLIDDQIAVILFDWAYRCTIRGHPGEGLRIHWASLRSGRRLANALAILKIPATLALRGAGRSGKG